jgi:hypothetical protein
MFRQVDLVVDEAPQLWWEVEEPNGPSCCGVRLELFGEFGVFDCIRAMVKIVMLSSRLG